MVMGLMVEVADAPPTENTTRGRARGAGGTVAPRGRRLDAGARSRRGVYCRSHGPREGYRMGRWERLAMTVIVTLAIVVGALTMLLRPDVPATRTITVLPGETVASIVMRELPDADFSRAVDAVKDLNNLPGTGVFAGDVLSLPAWS